MGYISIYPPPTSTGDPPRLPGTFTASITSGGLITPLSVPQTALQYTLRDEMWKDTTIRDQDFDNSSQKGPPSAQHCTINAAQETIQEEDLTATPNSDDSDEFADMDELLAGLQQESTSASAKSDTGGMAGKVDDGTRGNSPANSSRSTVGSTQDLIILSDDESVGPEPDTDFSSLDIDLTAERDSYSPHIVNNELGDGDRFVSDGLAADHRDDGGDNSNDGIVDIAKDLEDGECSASAEERGEDGDNPRSTKTSKLSAVSGGNPAFNGNMSGLQDGHPDDAQSPQLGPAVASLHQSNLSDHLPKQLPRRGATGNIRRKPPRTAAPIQLASAVSTVSAAPGSTDLEEAQRRAIIAAPVQERELHETDLEMVNGGGTDHSSDGDTAGSKTEGRPRFRKRVRTKGVETLPNTCDVEVCPPTGSVDISSGAKAGTLLDIIQESEEIPVHGSLKLKMLGQDVVYCLTVSQGSLPHPLEQKEDFNEEPQPTALVTPSQEWPICDIVRHKIIGDEMHYFVGWDRSWLPESEMGGAKELLEAYRAKLRHTQGRSEDGLESRGQKRSQMAIGGPDVLGEADPKKKRRGRPRKQI